MIARCFVALELGADARRAAEEAQLLLPGDAVRKATAESMHITIKFLGDVDVDAVGRKVLAALGPLASGPPIALGEGRLVGFPATERAHVIVLECHGAEARIADLAARAEVAAETWGVARESRAFRPHVTLARSKNDFDATKLAARFGSRPLGLAGPLVLFESAGGRYTPLEVVTPSRSSGGAPTP